MWIKYQTLVQQKTTPSEVALQIKHMDPYVSAGSLLDPVSSFFGLVSNKFYVYQYKKNHLWRGGSSNQVYG